MNQQSEYFDGQSAARHAVTLQFDARSLHITGETISRRWSYDDIRYASEDPTDLPLRLRCQSAENDASRLVIADQAIIDGVRLRCTDLEDRVRRRQSRKRGAVWAAAGIVALGLIVWSSVHFLPRLIAPIIPVTWEEELGEGVVDDITDIFSTFTEGEIRRCETADGRLAMDKLTGLLVSQIESPYTFKVIVLDIEIVNALAAPGGHIVVFKKLLTEAISPDEVAGVLAHEMGHVISRHPTEAVARSMGISLVFNVLLGGMGSGATGALGQALVSSAYSRDAERDADRIALDILGGAQISPKDFAGFFDRISELEGDTANALSFISSHPPSDERAKAARRSISSNVRPALSETDWRALQAICGEKDDDKS